MVVTMAMFCGDAATVTLQGKLKEHFHIPNDKNNHEYQVFTF